mgnify:FL=1
MYILGDVKDFFRFSRKPTTTDTPQIQPLVANMHGCNVSEQYHSGRDVLRQAVTQQIALVRFIFEKLLTVTPI